MCRHVCVCPQSSRRSLTPLAAKCIWLPAARSTSPLCRTSYVTSRMPTSIWSTGGWQLRGLRPSRPPWWWEVRDPLPPSYIKLLTAQDNAEICFASVRLPRYCTKYDASAVVIAQTQHIVSTLTNSREWSISNFLATSPEILHDTIWKTWLFILLADWKMILPAHYLTYTFLGRTAFWTWEWKGYILFSTT